MKAPTKMNNDLKLLGPEQTKPNKILFTREDRSEGEPVGFFWNMR